MFYCILIVKWTSFHYWSQPPNSLIALQSYNALILFTQSDAYCLKYLICIHCLLAISYFPRLSSNLYLIAFTNKDWMRELKLYCVWPLSRYSCMDPSEYFKIFATVKNTVIYCCSPYSNFRGTVKLVLQFITAWYCKIRSKLLAAQLPVVYCKFYRNFFTV